MKDANGNGKPPRYFWQLQDKLAEELPELQPKKLTRPREHRSNACSNPSQHKAERCPWEPQAARTERIKRVLCKRWNIAEGSYAAYKSLHRRVDDKDHEQFFDDMETYLGVTLRQYRDRTPSGYSRGERA